MDVNMCRHYEIFRFRIGVAWRDTRISPSRPPDPATDCLAIPENSYYFGMISGKLPQGAGHAL